MPEQGTIAGPMTPERWQRLKSIVARAVELPAGERAAFLDERCTDDATRRQLETLCGAYDSDNGLLDSWIVEPARPVAGDVIGPFLLEEKLGEGGMGEVWRARQESPIRRTVALKILRPYLDREARGTRFTTELQALAAMGHAGIAQVYDAGVSPEGRPYFAMELIEGEPITTYCRRHRLGLRQRLGLFRAVCEAVHHAHRKGFIHRDLKPSNILVSPGDPPRPRVIDFGVARVLDGASGTRTQTLDGLLVGTPDYMSPEQATGRPGMVDARTDVYSLGVVLYELLAGVLPLSLPDPRQDGLEPLLEALREQLPPTPSERAQADDGQERVPGITSRELRGDLDRIALKALAKDPAARYGSAAQLGRDVHRFLRGEPVLAGPPGLLYPLRKLVRRHRLVFAALFAVSLGLILAVSGTALGLVRARAAEQKALAAAEEATREATASEEITRFLLETIEAADPLRNPSPNTTVRELLDRGSARVREELSSQPGAQARVMASMGRAYRSLGLYESALALAADVVEIQRRHFGDDSIEVAHGLLDQAFVLSEMGRYEASRSLLERSLELRRHHFGDGHPEMAPALTNLGIALKNLGQLEAARDALERALRIREKHLGVDDVHVARTLDNLGVTLIELSHYEAARQVLERALDVHEQALGPEHPALSFSLTNLSIAVASLGDTATARQYVERALAIDERVLGPDHPYVGIGLANLAELAEQEGNCDTAERHYRRALTIFTERHGTGHASVDRAQRALAKIVSDCR